jgi:hypothetical protein
MKTHEGEVVGGHRVALSTNGLELPSDFPSASYEEIHSVIVKKHAQHALYEHYAGAWNAIAYRFLEATERGDEFAASVGTHGAAPPPKERYHQERALFDFFSSGFSVFEATFYGLFAIGGLIAPASFPLGTPREQQLVTPSSTNASYSKAFPRDPVLADFAMVFGDVTYQAFRETRNILTHRAAPGRRMFVSIGADDAPPTEWKLNDMPLDASIATKGRADLARLVAVLLDAAQRFVTHRFP